MYRPKYVCLRFSNYNRLFIKSFVLYSTFYQLAITRWQKGVIMERLVDNIYSFKGKVEECENTYLLAVQKKLKDYEDLEEQSRLLKLPCKVGDDVYYILGIPNETSCTIDKCTFELSDINKIGKTIFLTKSEAESKLKELRGGE